jgi:type IV secretory pathway protease TraF
MNTRYRSTDAATAIAGLFVIAVLAIVGVAVGAWLTMVGLGILHTHFMSAIPALGYKDSAWTMIGLWLVVGLSSFGWRITSSK